MRRIRTVLAVMALMAALVAVSAVPAFADAKPPNASCFGVLFSTVAPEYNGHKVGESASDQAKYYGGLGQHNISKEDRGPYSGFSPNC